MPFFILSGSEFVEMFVGVGAARVRDLFEQAKDKAPCIIFIDELDAIGKSRAGNSGFVGGHDEREQTLNQLLAEMDGFDSSKGVIIMAATNRPEVLDPALLRPGRFDRQVVVDKPDVRGPRGDPAGARPRRDAGGRGRSARDRGPHARLRRRRPGQHRQRGRPAGRAQGARTPSTWPTSRRRSIASSPASRSRAGCSARRSATSSPTTRWATRSWRSSVPHADPVHKITIIPRGVAALGMTYQLPIEDRFLLTRSELEDRIAVLLGGRVAEELVYGEVSTGAHNDLDRASELARLMVTKYGMSERIGLATYGERTPLFLKVAGGGGGDRDYSDATARSIDEEVRAILDRSHDRVRGLLTAKKAVLVHAASELKRVETLDGEKLKRLLAGES